jgi:hypothetical protein
MLFCRRSYREEKKKPHLKHQMGQCIITLLPYILENETDSISLLSSVLGVNRMRLLVILDASTSSAFS